jgi:hypothetical protein
LNRQHISWIIILAVAVTVGFFNLAYGIAFLAAFIVPILDSLGIFGKREELKETQRKELQRKLTEIFSPIHFMVENMKRHIKLGDENGRDFLGGFAPVSELGDFEKVRAIFVHHGHELPEGALQEWMNNLQLHYRNETGPTTS